MKYDGILFDLDGTLWDATEQIAEAWSRVIVQAQDELTPYGKGGPLTADGARALCGKTMDAIADELFGAYPGKKELADCCYAYENDYLLAHPGVLYPGIRQALEALSCKAPLYVVSNCQAGYIEVFFEVSGLLSFFSGHLSFGDTGLPKGDNIRLLCQQEGLHAPLYIGDTLGDADAAMAAGVPFAHARYGFGKVPEAELFVETPEGLISLL